MNVSLPPNLVDFVDVELASGDYWTVSEVVREALRLLRREQALRDERLTILRQVVGVGMDDVTSGRLSSRSVADIASDLDEA